jgi:hypothetical protein
MRTIAAWILALSATAGCATFHALPSDHRIDSSSNNPPSIPPSASAMSAPTPHPGPSLVLPATGGAPVMAIHLGGGIYLPLTGGAPVVGIPLAPH